MREVVMPWNHPQLEGWTIIGMNHYFVGGKRHLYVAMTDREVKLCIKAHGSDEERVFEELRHQAAAHFIDVGVVLREAARARRARS